MVTQVLLGIRPLELQGHKELEEHSVEFADSCRQVPTTARALAVPTSADGVGIGYQDPIAGSAKPLQGGRQNLPKVGSEET